MILIVALLGCWFGIIHVHNCGCCSLVPACQAFAERFWAPLGAVLGAGGCLGSTGWYWYSSAFVGLWHAVTGCYGVLHPEAGEAAGSSPQQSSWGRGEWRSQGKMCAGGYRWAEHVGAGSTSGHGRGWAQPHCSSLFPQVLHQLPAEHLVPCLLLLDWWGSKLSPLWCFWAVALILTAVGGNSSLGSFVLLWIFMLVCSLQLLLKYIYLGCAT